MKSFRAAGFAFVFAILLFLASPLPAKCPTYTVKIRGRIECSFKPDDKVLATLIFVDHQPEATGEETAIDIHSGTFDGRVAFHTYSSSNPVAGDVCNRRPKNALIRLIEADGIEKERTSLKIPNDFNYDQGLHPGFSGKFIESVIKHGILPATTILITAVGAIDIIIPPSIPMIVYGTAAQESVPRLYAAGVLPGLLIAAMIAVYVVWYAKRHNFEHGHRFSLQQFGKAFVRGIWALGAPFIILGGIYGGVFSPTEAAAVACVYAVLVTWLVFRELGWRDVLEAASTTALFTGQVLIIVACASVFAWLLTVNQVPAAMVAWIQSLNVAPWQLLLAINVLLLAVGCFLDPLSAILLLTPLLIPMVKAVGIDTVHFGIVFTVNLAIGLFHPPFGINIFVAQSALGLKLDVIYRGIIPFIVLYLIALLLITYVPWISLVGVKLFLGY